MNGPLAVGGACLTVSGVGAVVLARYWPARPASGGRHRAPAALPPAPLPVPAPLAEVPPRREALDIRTVWCPVQHAETRHVHFRLGGLMCLDCTPREAS